MPKKRKYPKQPKASASLKTWENWEKRCAEVAKHNKAIEDRPDKIAAIKARVAKKK